MSGLFAGIDFGTSGCRGIVIDGTGKLVAGHGEPMPPPHRNDDSIRQDPEIWWQAFLRVAAALAAQVDLAAVRALAIDGTSGTFTLVDRDGRPVVDALMYNDTSGRAEAAAILAVCPRDSAATGSSSPLARLLHLRRREQIDLDGLRLLHQADWIAGRLAQRFDRSDESNSLKLGYDPIARRWPDWLIALGIPAGLLPTVVPCGAPTGPVGPAGRALGFSADLQLVAGTTDGVASFLATGADMVGDGVTALGSTLVIKQLCARPIFAAEYGIYSHRIGELWLAGGASNAGGAALAAQFDAPTIERLSAAIDPDRPSGLDYYPLVGRGERFPIADPDLEPRLSPRPKDDVLFLQGMLEGIAAVERLAYRRLGQLGAPPLTKVRTVGGGAGNAAWSALRRRALGVDLLPAAQNEAAYGSALLALRAVEGR
ncbi:MAG TPA: FGGY-family carbohydrate kinase [Aliidongia sp.]|uniref:FGGY-family carbohydrate kinase n=1 Tax=Aliidongia sp. TaxID=1914230 RepID=UPI002DDCC94E|nr:FGGY-family carbohydrate kinase [Aliidongia sp.]HEV2677689.1 FGGY-family carbohydrate kinase [Aliidongia sp.]